MKTRTEPTTSAGPGAIDNADGYVVDAPPLIDMDRGQPHDNRLHAVAAMLSVVGLLGPLLFRSIAVPALYIVAVAGPFILALVFAGLRPVGPNGASPPSCAFRGVIIAVGFLCLPLTIAQVEFTGPIIERLTWALCFTTCAIALYFGLKRNRLALIIVGFASFSMILPASRIIDAYTASS